MTHRGKRDPTDFSRSEVVKMLRETFSLTLDQALAEDFPPPDYGDRRQKFWWASRVSQWVQEWLVINEARVKAHSNWLYTENARLRAEYERSAAAASKNNDLLDAIESAVGKVKDDGQ